MAVEAAKHSSLSNFEKLRLAHEILVREAKAIEAVTQRLDDRFCQAVDLLVGCRGSVIVCGMGKAGLIGQKIMATMASTGTRSHCLHPAEALHGDLGRVHQDDVVLLLSQSGETEEILRLLPSLKQLGVPIIAITSRSDSSLGKAADVVLELGPIQEACPLGLAPSASTTAMLALGDALALVASRVKNFGWQDFARFHPAGSLGRKLSRVEEHMRPLDRCRVARDNLTVREVFVATSIPGRRSGAVMLVNDSGNLTGIFTDSDLARLFEQRKESLLDRPICELMTRQPITIEAGRLLRDALELMAEKKISELPVIDKLGRPIGMLDITDMVGLVPQHDVSQSKETGATVCKLVREDD